MITGTEWSRTTRVRNREVPVITVAAGSARVGTDTRPSVVAAGSARVYGVRTHRAPSSYDAPRECARSGPCRAR